MVKVALGAGGQAGAGAGDRAGRADGRSGSPAGRLADTKVVPAGTASLT